MSPVMIPEKIVGHILAPDPFLFPFSFLFSNNQRLLWSVDIIFSMYLIFNIYVLFVFNVMWSIRKASFAHLKWSLEARSYTKYWFKPEMKLLFFIDKQSHLDQGLALFRLHSLWGMWKGKWRGSSSAVWQLWYLLSHVLSWSSTGACTSGGMEVQMVSDRAVNKGQ